MAWNLRYLDSVWRIPVKAITYLSAVAILVLGSSNVFARDKFGGIVNPGRTGTNKVQDVERAQSEKATTDQIKTQEELIRGSGAAASGAVPGQAAEKSSGIFAPGQPAAQAPKAGAPALRTPIGSGAAKALTEGGDGSHAPGLMPHGAKNRVSTADSDMDAASKEKRRLEGAARAEELSKMDLIAEMAGLKTNAAGLKGLSSQIEVQSKVFDGIGLTKSQRDAMETAVQYVYRNAVGDKGVRATEALPTTLKEIAEVLKNAKSKEEREMLVQFFLGAIPFHAAKGTLGTMMSKWRDMKKGNADAYHGFMEYMAAAGRGLVVYTKTAGKDYDPNKVDAEMREAMKDWAQKRLADNHVPDVDAVAKELELCALK